MFFLVSPYKSNRFFVCFCLQATSLAVARRLRSGLIVVLQYAHAPQPLPLWVSFVPLGETITPQTNICPPPPKQLPRRQICVPLRRNNLPREQIFVPLRRNNYPANKTAVRPVGGRFHPKYVPRRTRDRRARAARGGWRCDSRHRRQQQGISCWLFGMD